MAEIAAAPSAPRRLDAVSGLFLVALCVAEIADVLFDLRALRWIGAGAFLGFLLVGGARLGMRERYLIAVAALSIGVVWRVAPDPVAVVEEAAGRAAFLAAFLLLLALLRDGAERSGSVLAVGRWLTRQPPGRRYWALASGGHLMGVMMNFGALSLLAPLVLRGARAEIGRGDADQTSEAGEGARAVAEIRERRQLSALGRGFSWFIVWSPTSIAQIASFAAAGVAQPLWAALVGVGLAAMAVVIGWAEDRAVGARARARLAAIGAAPPPSAAPETPWPALRRLALVYAGLIGLSLAIAAALDAPMAVAIMLAAAPATALWLAAQRVFSGADHRLGARLSDIRRRALPDASPEAATLGLAGFIGVALAGAAPPGALDALVDLAAAPPALVYVGAMIVVALASLAALPPILTVTLIGGLLSQSAGAALTPELLALALVCGWAVNLTGSPFGATNLITARVSGRPATRLAFVWQGAFTLLAAAAAAAVIVALSALLDG